jgi:hypothetical protein
MLQLYQFKQVIRISRKRPDMAYLMIKERPTNAAT